MKTMHKDASPQNYCCERQSSLCHKQQSNNQKKFAAHCQIRLQGSWYSYAKLLPAFSPVSGDEVPTVNGFKIGALRTHTGKWGGFNSRI
jgi:hypothetical protein